MHRQWFPRTESVLCARLFDQLSSSKVLLFLFFYFYVLYVFYYIVCMWLYDGVSIRWCAQLSDASGFPEVRVSYLISKKKKRVPPLH